VYYFSERESLLLVLEVLVKASQDPSHLYHSLSALVLDEILSDGTLEKHLLKQLGERFRARVPSRFEADPFYGPLWAVQILREQKCLLQILIILYYERLKCSSSHFLEIVDLFIQVRFGNDQMNRSYLDTSPGLSTTASQDYSSSGLLLQTIAHQCVILFTELLNLEDLMGDVSLQGGPSSPSGHLLKDSPESVLKAHHLLWNFFYANQNLKRTRHPNFGPIALIWSTYTQRLLSLLESGPLPNYKDLVQDFQDTSSKGHPPQLLLQFAYLDLHAIPCLTRDLKSKLYESHSPHALAYASILKGFLTLFLSTQNMTTLPSRHDLVSCLSALFRTSEELAIQFWEQDYSFTERRSLLDTCRRTFPLEFKPFMELLSSLVASPKSARYASLYFQNLKTFTDEFDETRYALPGFSRVAQTRVVSRDGNVLVRGAKDLKLQAKEGDVAHFIARDVILLEYEYSGFHLLLSVIDSFLNDDGLSSVMNSRTVNIFNENEGDSQGGLSGSRENVVQVIQFLARIFENLDKTGMGELMAHFGDFLNICLLERGEEQENAPEFIVKLLTRVLDKCCNSTSFSVDSITSSLQCLSVLLKFYPHVVWRSIRALTFFPKCAFSQVSHGLQLTSPGTSFLQSVVLPAERERGTYRITNMFLRLVLDLVRDAQTVKSAR
jgi:hypothetical protein